MSLLVQQVKFFQLHNFNQVPKNEIPVPVYFLVWLKCTVWFDKFIYQTDTLKNVKLHWGSRQLHLRIGLSQKLQDSFWLRISILYSLQVFHLCCHVNRTVNWKPSPNTDDLLDILLPSMFLHICGFISVSWRASMSYHWQWQKLWHRHTVSLTCVYFIPGTTD